MKFWLSLVLLGCGFSPQAIAQSLSASVVTVQDGDTITVNQVGKKIKVRLSCIDAAELAQTPYGQSAKKRLQALLPSGTIINLRIVDQDRYGRTVAEVFKGNLSINLAMVQEGQAVIYRQYFGGCRQDKEKYEQAESRAKQGRLGLWHQKNPVMPWAFRNVKTSPVSGQISTSTSTKCDLSYPDVCLPPNVPDLDCQDIPERRFRVLPPDRHRLDRDGDGIGCETN